MAARMRGIEQAYKELKAMDPETELTPTGFRRLVTTGQIQSVKIGAKYLINLDVLESFLAGGKI